MSNKDNLNDCGCCAGIDAETPALVYNRPSLQSIQYRVGKHSQFRESMIAALSSEKNKALSALTTRDEDDFSIAFLDSVAAALDVLSFHTERYAQENYLNTAVERLSVIEMARLIGYEPAPGVAASTHLAFTLLETPGMAISSIDPITITAGTRVQSVPGQDETPQIFETTEDVPARPEWNAIPVQTVIPWHPTHGDQDMYVEGIANNLEAGDTILIVGEHRIKNTGSERWDVRVLSAVETDQDKNRTRLVWDNPLGHTGPTIHPAEKNVQVYVFRKRAALFGHNAPDPRLMSVGESQLIYLVSPNSGFNMKWDNYSIQNKLIDLDVSYKNIVTDSWVALLSNDDGYGTASLPGYLELYRVKKVYNISRSDFGVSGKITRIKPDGTEHLDYRFGLRDTLVFAESEELTATHRPLLYPLYGSDIKLDNLYEAISPGQFLSVSGKPQRIVIAPGVSGANLVYEGGNTPLSEGDSLILSAAPEKLIGSTRIYLSPTQFYDALEDGDKKLHLSVTDIDGITGILIIKSSKIRLGDASDDEFLTEVVQIDHEESAITTNRFRTSIELISSLTNVYQRDTVRVNFNVAPATHGESVEEISGNGDARLANQTFMLKQQPLTYTSASTPSGRKSSLEVRVNDLLWDEAETLYQQAKESRSYKVQHLDDDYVNLMFGDGVEGSRIPTGMTNVRAKYRKGIGVDANLDKNKLTTLLLKPLGVSEVTNPEASTGGEDPEDLDKARVNAPVTVLTLDRAVSEKDYKDYSRAFAGVDKAHALWIPSGPSSGIFISVAGIDGVDIPEDSKTYHNLIQSLRNYGDPLLPLTVKNYHPASFSLSLAVKVAAEVETETVLSEVSETVQAYFSFQYREFGQNVSQDEVVAVVHSVSHVEAVQIKKFYKNAPGVTSGIADIIASNLPIASLTEAPEPAELLLLADEPLLVEEFI